MQINTETTYDSALYCFSEKLEFILIIDTSKRQKPFISLVQNFIIDGMRLQVCLYLGLAIFAIDVYGCAVPNHINTNSPKTLATQKLANALECLCKTIALVPVEMAGNINYPLNGYKRSQLTDTLPFVNDPANCRNRCYLEAHCPYRSSLYTMMYAYNNITGIVKTVYDTQLIDRNYGGTHDLDIRCNPIDQQWYTNGTRVDMIGCSILFDG